MWRGNLGNAKEFPFQEIKCIQGQIPKGIKGRYFRNGPSQLVIQNSMLNHWFYGDGAIIMLEIKDGKCWAMLKFQETEMRRMRSQTKNLSPCLCKKLFYGAKYSQADNPANTSLLPMKESEKLLALYEAGKPLVINKKDLQTVGFNDFGWIESAYSAHPKVDPENGDIYNFGTNFKQSSVTIYHSTKDMKLIRSNSFKLRSWQTIHDMCLAGDYIVIFESSVSFSVKRLLVSASFLTSLIFDENLPVLIHIFRKKDLSHVKTIETEPFFIFHFANGFSTDKKIVVQYARVNPKEAVQLFQFLMHAPNYVLGSEKQFDFPSILEEVHIDLQTLTHTFVNLKEPAEFPVCEDHQVGKEWRYTYCVVFKENPCVWGKLGKYDRVENKWTIHAMDEGDHIGEPAIIRVGDKVYLLALVNNNKKTRVEIFDGDNLATVCKMELPEFVTAGFHGKWDIEL